MSDQHSGATEEDAAVELDVDDRIDEANDAGEQSPDDVDVEQLEREREERLDPDNRPDGAEIDNTGRDFDPEVGLFTDSEGYEEAKAEVESEKQEEDSSDEGDADDVVDTEAAAETTTDEAAEQAGS